MKIAYLVVAHDSNFGGTWEMIECVALTKDTADRAVAHYYEQNASNLEFLNELHASYQMLQSENPIPVAEDHETVMAANREFIKQGPFREIPQELREHMFRLEQVELEDSKLNKKWHVEVWAPKHRQLYIDADRDVPSDEDLAKTPPYSFHRPWKAEDYKIVEKPVFE
jgi:hypothetical protein